MAFLLETPPFKDDIAVPADSHHPLVSKLPKFVVGKKWIQYFTNLVTSVEERPARKASVLLTGQAAAIATTPLPIGSVSMGVWRISATLRVTQAATTSSAVRLTVAWTERGVAQTQQGTNLNGNLTTTREGLTFVIRVDGNTPISYSTTYASVGATSMQYSLDIVAEELAADPL